MMALAGAVVGAVLLASPIDAGRAWLDRLDDSLFVELGDGFARADLGVVLDVEGYLVDRRPPALLFGGDGDFVNPRLSLFLDTRIGRRLYSLVHARLDRGFDPRSESFDARADEYLLRYTPFDSPVVSLQAGKFATVVGNWVLRHDSWSNPLVNAPLPYENVTIAGDLKAAPDAAAFLRRRQIADNKPEWVPILWGPVYATGVAAFGRVSLLEYAIELKNAALSSRPSVWNGRERGFDDPTVGGRLGVRPGPAWALGVSASHGAYLRGEVRPTLPPGASPGDFAQTLVAADATYAWRHWEIWTEGFLARFEVPNVGDADSAAWYLELRRRLTRTVSAAFRWNQQVFSEVRDGRGGEVDWDADAWRVDTGLTWRFDRHAQAKIQHSYTHQQGGFDPEEHLGIAQLTIRF